MNPRKPIFDAVIAASPANPFNVPGRIQALHDLLDSWGVRRAPETVTNTQKTSKAGIDLMHEFEGLHRVRPDGMVEAYLCPAKVWTIGWGSTGPDPFNGGTIRKGTVWTRAQCDTRFEQHLEQFERGVLEGLKGKPATQGQFDAMVSLAYNIGVAAFQGSTLLRKHIAGEYDAAAKEFLRWNRGGGKVLAGLTRRREAEAKLYRGC